MKRLAVGFKRKRTPNGSRETKLVVMRISDGAATALLMSGQAVECDHQNGCPSRHECGVRFVYGGRGNGSWAVKSCQAELHYRPVGKTDSAIGRGKRRILHEFLKNFAKVEDEASSGT